MGVELITTGRMTVNGPNLRITDLTLDDTGSYTCVVNNAEDSAKDSKSIQVIPKGMWTVKKVSHAKSFYTIFTLF